MKTIYDVQQLLKRYGTFVYTGNRLGDLELMDMELTELYKWGFINGEDYTMAKLLLRSEISKVEKEKRGNV
ncbi:cytosolic protein [Oceanobacillus picturae]|uniref:Cytosolic protein n=1 Tax=Oceanobacillus picturae TaxID=171693 RepID=A0A0U9HCL7_9BACI|nr:YqgQ family protein [Oceanobacillus picturae]GAQ19808.1 cytosolic protein [Oceanobacillus picturae]